MTILDTFAIKFTTDNVEQAKNDIKALDQQISQLAAKGNKRNDEEKKQLDALRKQRVAVTQDLKDQTRATDALGDSFGGLATKILGVGAALFGLNALKTGVLSAVDKNVSLANQARVSGQNPNDLRAISAIVESAGGSGEGAAALIDSMRRAANARGIAFTNPIGLLNQANEDVQGKPIEQQARILEQLYGITDEALESELEKTTDEWRKIVDLKKQSTALTAQDYSDAVELKGDITSLGQSWERFYSKLGTATFPSLELLLNIMNEILSVSEKAQKVSEFVFGSYRAHGGSFFGSNHGAPSQYAPASEETQTSKITPKTGNAAVDFWLSQGMNLNGAIGMATMEQAESSGDPTARKLDNKGRMHYGLYQFDPTRRDEILSALNIDVATASADDQRKAAAWDARRRIDKRTGRTDFDLINSGTSGAGSAAIANSYFEVSGEDPRLRRTGIANQLAAQYSVSQQGGAGGGLNVKIDNVTVNTQATDADGVSKDFATALKGHLDDLYSDTNDGIDR